MYNSFELWLEETRLNKILHLRPESFPPAYDLNRLAQIFAGSNVWNIKFNLYEIIKKSVWVVSRVCFFSHLFRPIGLSTFNCQIFVKYKEMPRIHGFEHVYDTLAQVNIQHQQKNQ